MIDFISKYLALILVGFLFVLAGCESDSESNKTSTASNQDAIVDNQTDPPSAQTPNQSETNDGNATNPDNTDSLPQPLDTDGDSFPDNSDNCPAKANPGQADSDGDGIGNACDATPLPAPPDADGDSIPDSTDNCPTKANSDQLDMNKDGIGDACELDLDISNKIFWEYRSSNMSASEIAAYNDPQTGIQVVAFNRFFHFDTDHPNHWFIGGLKTQHPKIDDVGRLVAVRQLGDTDPHSSIQGWTNYSGPTAWPSGRSLKINHRYRFGFDLFLPSDAKNWIHQIPWTVLVQAHQVSDNARGENDVAARNPPFAIEIEAVNGKGHWVVVTRGDNRRLLPNKQYQYAEKHKIPVGKLNKWYRFVVDVVWSYQEYAETKVWLDGKLIYNRSVSSTPGFMNAFNDVDPNGNNIGPALPATGLYNYDLPASPMTVMFDNIWIADFGPVPQ